MAELRKLGRYELRRVLGKGAMGVVYEGFDPSLGRRVAVKTILKSVALDSETERAYAARFVQEAKAVARLNHPNIVQVYDFAIEGDAGYLVMEFIEGRELRSFFEAKEKFDTAETVRIMGELLDALHFAHEAGVVHRDVKPANVMLDGQRRAKLTDFGVARVQDSDRSAAGTMVGTPAFMSPEQISGGKIDRRTDVFSAGVVLYQLLTGEQPFTGEGAWTVAKKIMEDDPPRPSAVVKSISPVFDGIVSKALAKKQANRYASAREFADAVRGALGAAPIAAPATPIVLPQQKPKPASSTSEAEVEFWKAIQNSTDSAEFEFYLEQFPEGTYAALARHKIARLGAKPDAGAESTVRLEAEAAERQRKEAEERARREAEGKTRLAAQAEAEARAKKVAEELAQRQAAGPAKLKQQEQARKSAAVDPEATVALPQQRAAAAAPTPPAEQKKSLLVPVLIGALVIVAGAVAFFALNRKPAPAPVAEAPAPAPAPAPKTEVSAADIEKIKKDTEERIRREYADKSAAEQAAAAKVATEKAIAEKQAAAEKLTAAKAAAEKAAAEKALAEKLSAARAAGEKAAQERVAAERAAAEKAAAEKAGAEKAAADAAAAKATAEKLAAAKTVPSNDELLEKFIQRHGRDKVLAKEPPNVFGAMRTGEVVYVNDGSCGAGRIREVTGGGSGSMSAFLARPREYRCISLNEGAGAERVAAARPAAPRAAADDELLEKFVQRHGRDKVVANEPPQVRGAMRGGETIYVNDGSCGPGRIREVMQRAGGGFDNNTASRESRCVSLKD